MISLHPLAAQLRIRRTDLDGGVIIDSLRRLGKDLCQMSLGWKVNVTAQALTSGVALQTPSIPAQTINSQSITVEPIRITHFEVQVQSGGPYQGVRPMDAAALDTNPNVRPNNGTPSRYIDRFGSFELWPAPSSALLYNATFAVSPTGEFDYLPFAQEFEEAFIEGALELIYAIDGAKMNLSLADYHGRRYAYRRNRMLAAVQATSGSPQMSTPTMIPRQRSLVRYY